jgi:hypothetical protein
MDNRFYNPIEENQVNSQDILAYIEDEIARLQAAKALLTGSTIAPTVPASTKPTPVAATSFAFVANGTAASRKRRTMSASGRARIAAAQRARWAKVKAAKK